MNPEWDRIGHSLRFDVDNPEPTLCHVYDSLNRRGVCDQPAAYLWSWPTYSDDPPRPMCAQHVALWRSSPVIARLAEWRGGYTVRSL